MDSPHKTPLSILFFLEGERVPASRFRVVQYEKLLGNEPRVQYHKLYTHPSKYLYYPSFVRHNLLRYIWAIGELLMVVLTRFLQIVRYARRYDRIYLQRDLLFRVSTPFLEAFLFWYTQRRRREGKVKFILDVDDAIFCKSDGSSSEALKKKSAYIAENCDLVIAGNRYLEEFFAQFAKTVLIPTTVDTERYTPQPSPQPNNIVTIGWTGVASNLAYLFNLKECFEELSSHYSFKLVIICEAGTPAPFSSSHFDVEMRGWQESTEIDELRTFDIGLMPLPDNAWTRGKCGFKLLQYMALQIPTVASPVGVNSSIIQHGENGFVANTGAEWSSHLAALINDPALRRKVGEVARKVVVERYSTQAWFERWSNTIKIMP